jgi:peptidyl-prolyl cis-trans isomerase A (cyclophilin A)
MLNLVVFFAAIFLHIDTTAGQIVVSLDPVHAPRTTKAYVRCVESGRYRGATFYRIVRPGNQSPHRPIQVVQGGANPDKALCGEIALEPTSRTGLRNLAGTIGVPRDIAPNTGSPSDFYINTIDNPLLDQGHGRDAYGYAVFGRVVRGMGVARKIEAAPARGQYLRPRIAIRRMWITPRFP